MTRPLPPHPAKRHPVAEFLSFVGALVVLGVALFLGLFFVAVAAGLILLATAAFAVRIWWLRRQIRQAVATQPDGKGSVIEGEYEVRDPEGASRAPDGKRLER